MGFVYENTINYSMVSDALRRRGNWLLIDYGNSVNEDLYYYIEEEIVKTNLKTLPKVNLSNN